MADNNVDGEVTPLNPDKEGPGVNKPVYDYDEAIITTVDPERPLTGKFYQIFIIFVTQSVFNSSNFLILGLPFLKSDPRNFRCKSRETGEWETCNK